MGKKKAVEEVVEEESKPIKVTKTIKKAKSSKLSVKTFLNKITKAKGIPNMTSKSLEIMDECIYTVYTDLMNLAASTLKPKTIFRPDNVHQTAVALFQLRGMSDKECQEATKFVKRHMSMLQTENSGEEESS